MVSQRWVMKGGHKGGYKGATKVCYGLPYLWLHISADIKSSLPAVVVIYIATPPPPVEIFDNEVD